MLVRVFLKRFSPALTAFLVLVPSVFLLSKRTPRWEEQRSPRCRERFGAGDTEAHISTRRAYISHGNEINVLDAVAAPHRHGFRSETERGITVLRQLGDGFITRVFRRNVRCAFQRSTNKEALP